MTAATKNRNTAQRLTTRRGYPLAAGAVGYAGTRPLVPNNTEQDRARNRRVEFLLHRPEVETW